MVRAKLKVVGPSTPKDVRSRKRAKSPPRGETRLKVGPAHPGAPAGLIPAKFAQRGQVRVEEPEDVFTTNRDGDWTEADTIRLAMHLGARLHAFAQSGKKLCGWEKLLPVLRAFVDVLKNEASENLSVGLAWTAVKVAAGDITPETALAWTRKARREQHWATKDGSTCSAEHIAKYVTRRRGPLPPLKKRAAQIYRVLAWDARVDVLPTLADERTSRNDRLSDLLNRQIEYRELVQTHAAGASDRNSRKKGES